MTQRILIERIVCKVEQAERLHALGISQNSIFYHSNFFDVRLPKQYKVFRRLGNGLYEDDCGFSEELHFLSHKLGVNTFSAFTGDELGIMLGVYIQIITCSSSNGFLVHEKSLPGNAHFYWKATEAEIRADLLIYLIENNLLTASDCNSRLEHYK